MTSNFKLSVHRSESEITSIVPKWLTVFESNPKHQFFHHPSWFLALQATVLEGKIAVCLVEDSEGPLAVLPLICSTTKFAKASFSSPIHDHISLTDWVLDARASSDEIVSALPDIAMVFGVTSWSKVSCLSVLESSDSLKQSNVFHESDVAEAGWNSKDHTCNTGVGQRRTRQVRESYWFNCLALGEHLKSKLKGNLRRRRKKAAGQGEVAFEAALKFPELETAFKDFLKIEASGWKGQQGTATAILNDPLLLAFYTQLLQSDIPGFNAMIFLLKIGEQPIAAQFVLSTKTISSLLKPAYDENYSELSPGLLLMEDVLNFYTEETEIEVASVVTSPKWAEPWKPNKERVFHTTIYNNNISGKGYFLVDAAKSTVRKLRGR